MASKSRSGLSETPNKAPPATPNKARPSTPNKGSPATPRVSKLGKGVSKPDSESPSPLQNSRISAEKSISPLQSTRLSAEKLPSPLQNSRLPAEKSPRSLNSKPIAERKSPRPTSTTPDKQPLKAAKGSELQIQLNLAQEDLNKAKEQLIQAEKEKAKAIDELKEAQRVAEEANEKLREAMVAQKRAEEDSEIEKFRAVELEQAGLEAVQKKDEEWQKELESVRNQHALDVASLLSTAQELQRVKQELVMTCDAKNQALSHAEDATKIAEVHMEKVEILSAEIARLKALLDSKLETEASENKIVLELQAEIEALKLELEKAKGYDEKLMEKETYIEQLNVEFEAAKLAESYAHCMLEEWTRKVEELEMRVEEANKLERSASLSLESVMKELEGNNDLLHDAESEISSLKEKVGLLEMTIGRQRADLEDSEHRLLVAKDESLEMSKKIEFLKSELETVNEEKAQALKNERVAASSVQSLIDEKNKLINELEICRDEEEKTKNAMESLASALHEVSAEARDAKEKLLANQAEHEFYEAKIEDLKSGLKATDEKYESMLNDARHEIDVLTCSVENHKNDIENSKAEWEQKELHLVNCLKLTEEENSSLGKEINRLIYSLKKTEEEASAKKEEEAQLKENLKEVEAEVIHLQEALKEESAQSMKLKERLLDKENEFQNIFQENEDLRSRESTSIKKVEELSKLLEEATIRNHAEEENGDHTDSEKDYDLLPKVVEFSEENGHGGEDISKVEVSANEENGLGRSSLEESILLNDKSEKTESPKPENVNGKLKEDESREKSDSVEGEFKMWESCTIEKKEFSPERVPKPVSYEEEEVESKKEDSVGVEQINGGSVTENIDNGGSSPSKQQVKKKKKALLVKFGSLLKKKGGSNHK
ncbi:WEB family protein At3g02930, chloroplastic-like [Lotus japonicus]|uniref:WEB family protein At3g02930, chloroplastic-like n=1 Tax=Lotus japonicus TaxID=34305 RepID=UPI0025877C91|nr:WEB family protein At3g02930, chloroplastic-like [Lotus japonicus]